MNPELKADLTDVTQKPRLEIYSKHKYLKYINFSALSGLLFPFSNLVTVPVIYLVYKKKLLIPTENDAALKIISFQVVWSAFTLVLLVFTPLIDHVFLHLGDIFEIPLFVWVYLVLIFSHLLVTLTAATRLNEDENPVPFVPNLF